MGRGVTVIPEDKVALAYGRRAAEYARLFGSASQASPSDQEHVATWSRQVSGRILDAGCGPGHWTAHMTNNGADVIGIDLTPEFVDIARHAFPDSCFVVADLRKLPFERGELGGILAWYSLIHLDPSEVPRVLAEFARCTRLRGEVLVGFFEGSRLEPFEHKVVVAYYWPMDELVRLFEAEGFIVTATETRQDPGHRKHGSITAVRSAADI